jgi:LmbE family N-acetylglucosaminyl deacetylase
MPKTVLAIAPHPDDAEFAAGGLLAKYARDGHKVLIAIATDGSLGGMSQVGPALAARRKGEARRAAAVLGASEPIFLGLPDFGLEAIAPAELRERLARLIREIRPDIAVLQDPAVFDPHPDHRALALAASDAAAFSGLPSIYPRRDRGDPEPWYVPERLFYADSPASADYFVDISDVIGLKVDAILAHESQLEFLVADVTAQAKAAGIARQELASVLGEGDAGPEGPASLMAMAVQKNASEIGGRAGFAFGEAFRRLRFHPYVEALIAADARSAPGGKR